jgi:predicted O-methyltransferase YrrM
MDKAFQTVLDRYNVRLKEERALLAAEPDRLIKNPNKFLLALGEPAARFLHALIVARDAKRILELGTSYGYSTLFFADAARQIGGKVISIDVSAEKQDHARRELTEAGLVDFVEFHTGDALKLLAQFEGPFDFVLLDIWKALYVPCLNLFRPKLAFNAVIAADNMIRPQISRPHAEQYRAAVRAAPELQTVLLPIGQGIELSCVWHPAKARTAP